MRACVQAVEKILALAQLEKIEAQVEKILAMAEHRKLENRCAASGIEEGAPEPVDWSYLATYNAIWCETGGCTYKMVTPYNSCNAVCGPEHECIRAYVQSNPSNYDIDCDDLANPSRVTLCECRRNEPYEG